MHHFYSCLILLAALSCHGKRPVPPQGAVQVIWEKNPHILNRHVYQFNAAASGSKKFWLYFPEDLTGNLTVRLTSNPPNAAFTHEPGGQKCEQKGDKNFQACEFSLTNPGKGEHSFLTTVEKPQAGDFTIFFGLTADKKL